jgi:hypothetical protein
MRLRAVLSVFMLLAAAAPEAQQAADVQRQLVGNWRLVKFDNFDEKGVARPSAYTKGRIMYDAAGQMAAQLMQDGRKPLSSPAVPEERAAAYGSFLSYFGGYTVDAAKGTVTHHVEGSTNPNWVSTPTHLVRSYAFSPDGNRLMLSVKNAEGRVTGTLTWERIR